MRWLAAFFHQNLGIKIFSLVLAYMSWAYVVGRSPGVRFVNAPVEFAVPDNLSVISYEPREVRVRLQGDVTALNRLLEQNVYARVALDQVAPVGRSHRVLVQERDILGVPSGIMREVQEPVIKVTLERRNLKTVPVRVRVSGMPPAGYQVARAWADPAVVEIGGPESVLRTVSEVSTEDVDITGKRASFTAEAPVARPDALVSLKPERIRVYVTVEEVPGPMDLEVPLAINDPAFTTDIETIKVRLEGAPSLLERVSGQLRATADASAVTGRAGTAPVRLDFGTLSSDEAASVRVALLEPARVRVRRVTP